MSLANKSIKKYTLIFPCYIRSLSRSLLVDEYLRLSRHKLFPSMNDMVSPKNKNIFSLCLMKSDCNELDPHGAV